MSNEPKPQEWFYLRNETWNGPFKTSGLKELVKKGAVGPNTLLRLGVAGAPIKAHQIKSLFPNYQGVEQTTASSSTKGNNSLAYKLGNGIRKTRGLGSAIAVLLVFVLGLIIFNVLQSNENVPRISLAERIASIEKEMVLIQPGKFRMGSPESEKGRDSEKGRPDNETQHEVTLTKPFYIGKYEITHEQWEGVMGNIPSDLKWKGAKLPVTQVSWVDCKEFIKKLNTKTDSGYRLPTEAEWEYACRAGTTTVYSFGDKITPKEANYSDSKIDKPVAVGSYQPNAFGLYDMHGNAGEWCEDWMEVYIYRSVTDPKGPATGKDRVIRGGAFYSSKANCRSSERGSLSPTYPIGDYGTGFRLARTADVKAAAHKPDLGDVMPATENLSVSPFSEAKADLGKGIKLELVLIPEGKFKMGSPESEKDRRENETQHEVTLTKPFYIGKYEVTQDQWQAIMGENPSSINKGANLPLTNVSWEDCQEFIKKLNAKTNGGYRLPTEAEWEYACRSGTSTAYSFGDSLMKSDANYGSSSAKAVGSYNPNAFGLYDMHGNVEEWCEDWYRKNPAGAVTDPKGPAKGEDRVVRGGSSYDPAYRARSSHRLGYLAPTLRADNVGFRLARTADLKAAFVPPAPKQDPTVVMPATVNLLVSPFNETKAKEVQKEVAKSLHKEVEDKADLGKGVKLDLVLIPAGKFLMGSPANEKGRDTDETQHEVTLTKPFYIGKYEVTQEQWEAVMGNNPSSRTKGAKIPVTDVSWKDCQEFIKKLNAKTNGGYRLPTEAEFEYAYRAGTTTAYSFGDSLTKSDANIEGDSIKAVGGYKPNPFGLYDMHGNVWEWCEDWKADYPAGSVTDPKGPATGGRRVLRGGSFDDGSVARSSVRGVGLVPTDRDHFGGFRLARTP